MHSVKLIEKIRSLKKIENKKWCAKIKNERVKQKKEKNAKNKHYKIN